MSDIKDEKEDKELKQLEENAREIEKVIKSMTSTEDLKTNILNDVVWETLEQQYIFDSLPLTMKQKEELLLSVYQN